MITVSPTDLASALLDLSVSYPDYRLTKLPVTGNLSIVDGRGVQVGYVDIYVARVVWLP